MISAQKRSAINIAIGLAIVLHLCLFVLTSSAPQKKSTPLPPHTQYIASSKENNTLSNARVLWSPVLFSLPSTLGFSQKLLQQKMKSPKTDFQQTDIESFLPIDPTTKNRNEKTDIRSLMISTQPIPLQPPLAIKSTPRPLSPRFNLTPTLKNRMTGELILPLALNQPAETPWEINAEITVSPDGKVQHVLLDHPLESAILSQSVIYVLQDLQFKKSEQTTEGFIHIYSPAPLSKKEQKP